MLFVGPYVPSVQFLRGSEGKLVDIIIYDVYTDVPNALAACRPVKSSSEFCANLI